MRRGEVIDLSTVRRNRQLCADGDRCDRRGRYELVPATLEPAVQIVGSDPYGSPVRTGLLVPTVATSTFSKRYLFQLARASFGRGECARLVGLRMYASIAGFPGVDGPSLIPRELQIVSPLWAFPDGNISWHVMRIDTCWRDTRSPAPPGNNTDSVIFQDTPGPALLFQTPPPGGYVPPNNGRPWGKPLASDLGNMHDLRYPWRDSQVEAELDVPVYGPCDVALFASVAQHNTALTLTMSSAQQAAAAAEDRFWAAFSSVQYNRIAGSLIFEEEPSP